MTNVTLESSNSNFTIALLFNLQCFDSPYMNFEFHPFIIFISTVNDFSFLIGWFFPFYLLTMVSFFYSISLSYSLLNTVLLDYSILLISGQSSFVSLLYTGQLIWEYLTLSCWSHFIWWGIRGAKGIWWSLFGFTLSSKSNSLEVFPLIWEAL